MRGGGDGEGEHFHPGKSLSSRGFLLLVLIFAAHVLFISQGYFYPWRTLIRWTSSKLPVLRSGHNFRLSVCGRSGGLFLCVCAHNSLSCHIFQWKHSLCLCSKLHAVIYLLCRKYPKVTLYTSDLVLSSLSVSSLLISHQPPPCSLLCSGHWSIWSCSPHIGC